MQLRAGTLWNNSDFLKLWAGETVSLFGSQITTLALPLTAALTFWANPMQMGILEAASFLPYLLFTLFAGVWVDRRRRHPLLIWGNLGRALLLGLIPLGTWLGILRLSYLYLIAFLTGVLAVFFQLAYQSYLPTLVNRSQLTEGNSKLSISDSLAQVVGPGLGGFLVQAVSAPFAILVDVGSFLFSALALSCIHTPEEPGQQKARRSIWQEIKEGLSMTFRNAYLRAIAGEAATYNLFYNCIAAVYVLFVLRDLHIAPAMYGLMLMGGSFGALGGAVLAGPLGRRWGIGPTLIGVLILACLLPLLIPLANGVLIGACWLTAISFFLNMGIVISNIHVVSLRQAITPNRLLGRMNASYRFVTWGCMPLGSLLGGFLGNAIGIRATLLVGALGVATACLWIIFSPIARLRSLPQLTDEEEITDRELPEKESTLVGIV